MTSAVGFDQQSSTVVVVCCEFLPLPHQFMPAANPEPHNSSFSSPFSQLCRFENVEESKLHYWRRLGNIYKE